jgi:hypothetical protein
MPQPQSGAANSSNSSVLGQSIQSNENVDFPVGLLYRVEDDIQWRSRRPHLNNVFKTSPSQYCKLTQYEFHGDWQIFSKKHFDLEAWTSNFDTCQQVVRGITSSHDAITTRLLIVEDISSNLIRLFCEEPDIDPDFFEEHLRQCGWTPPDQVSQVTLNESSG